MKNLLAIFILLFTVKSYAQNIPSSGDVSRISPFEKDLFPNKNIDNINIPSITMHHEVPEQAKKMSFFLKKIVIEGSTIFSPEELKALYGQYVGKNNKLSILWDITKKINMLYHDKGYFLAKAYIPEQKIDSGIVRLKIIEGKISDVLFDKELPKDHILASLREKILAKKVVHINDVERFLVNINNLPGIYYRSTMARDENNEEFIRILLESEEIKPQISLDVNNYASRFLNPYQATLSYQDYFLPYQSTTFTFLSDVEADHIRYGAFRHAITLTPSLSINASANHIVSELGGPLEGNDIENSSTQLSFGLKWMHYYSKSDKLSLSFDVIGKNTNGDVLGIPLSRDRIRKAVLGMNYSFLDNYQGRNFFSMALNQGIDSLGATKKGDINLSRADAVPDFTYVSANYQRNFNLSTDIQTIFSFSGQASFDPLHAAEEFGYGGQSFGRAYDNSEIVGDHGVASSIELRYTSLDPVQQFYLSPFAFYDIGATWDKNTTSSRSTASSAGFGMIFSRNAFSGQFGLAFPLTKNIDNPLSGNNRNPRFLMQMGYNF